MDSWVFTIFSSYTYSQQTSSDATSYDVIFERGWKCVCAKFNVPFRGFSLYQWLLYFSSKTMTRDPRNECSWVSLKEFTCWRTRRRFIKKSAAEFTSTFMATNFSLFFFLSFYSLFNLFRLELYFKMKLFFCTFYSFDFKPKWCDIFLINFCSVDL